MMTISDDYEAVIFDYDGVLVPPTSRAIVLQANRDAFQELGVPPDDRAVERVQDALDTAEPHEQLVEVLDDVAPSIDAEEYWTTRERLAAETQERLIEEGDKPLYRDTSVLDSIPIPTAIVSNNEQRTIDFSIDYFGWDSIFSLWFGREPSLTGLERQKPKPYYLHRAKESLGTTEILFVGDNESDLVAGTAAQLDTAIIDREDVEGLDFTREPAYWISSLTEL